MSGRPRKRAKSLAVLAQDNVASIIDGTDWQRRVSLAIVATVGTSEYSGALVREWAAIVKLTKKLGDVVMRAEAAGVIDSSRVEITAEPPEVAEESWVWMWRLLMEDARALVAGDRPIQHEQSAQLRATIRVAVDSDPPADRYLAQEALRRGRARAAGGPTLTPAQTRDRRLVAS